MNINDFKNKYIFTTRIDIDEESWIELREPSSDEMNKLGNKEDKYFEKLSEIFPSCIIKSSFVDDEGNPVSGRKVYDALKQSGTLYTEILSTWGNSLPFHARIKKPVK